MEDHSIKQCANVIEYLFSARTFSWHCEQVYLLSPSKTSFTVSSSRDSCQIIEIEAHIYK